MEHERPGGGRRRERRSVREQTGGFFRIRLLGLFLLGRRPGRPVVPPGALPRPVTEKLAPDDGVFQEPAQPFAIARLASARNAARATRLGEGRAAEDPVGDPEETAALDHAPAHCAAEKALLDLALIEMTVFRRIHDTRRRVERQLGVTRAPEIARAPMRDDEEEAVSALAPVAPCDREIEQRGRDHVVDILLRNVMFPPDHAPGVGDDGVRRNLV